MIKDKRQIFLKFCYVFCLACINWLARLTEKSSNQNIVDYLVMDFSVQLLNLSCESVINVYLSE